MTLPGMPTSNVIMSKQGVNSSSVFRPSSPMKAAFISPGITEYIDDQSPTHMSKINKDVTDCSATDPAQISTIRRDTLFGVSQDMPAIMISQ